MPAVLNYPGVYIEELPSGVHTITGVATSIAAFVGRAWRGPVDQPVMLFSYADYERQFGGLWRGSTMSYAVQQFFLNGGGQAIVVRVTTRKADGTVDATAFATADLGGGTVLVAAGPGTWGSNLSATIDYKTKDPTQTDLFNLTLYDDPKSLADKRKLGGSGQRETFLNVSTDQNNPRFVSKVLSQQSVLARVLTPASGPLTARPAIAAKIVFGTGTTNPGDDGKDLVDADVVGIEGTPKTGIYALENTDIFNLLCLPPLTGGAGGNDIGPSTWTAAATLCKNRRALLIVDAPATWSATDAVTNIATLRGAVDANHSAIYFPRLLIPDPLQENKLDEFAPCGVVAGVYARTDTARGIWKAPAGIDANLQGVLGLAIANSFANGQTANLLDGDVGQLNPLGINSLRALPVIGHVVWGARTLEGADALASQWKYVPVRRLALYIEESLFRGTQWVVFEPNDEPLWAQIRLNIGAFMQTLFRQGAFQGSTPRDAYFVKCSRETTTQTDIDNGVVNIIVGFAPLKPAEFVVIKIQQIAQQP